MALSYGNQNAIRSQPLIPQLEERLREAIVAVYGPGYSAQVYSGGQPGKDSGGRRTGSIRHDHGKAADIYVVGPDGKRVTGDRLGPLGQYWAAKRYGGVGLEMNGGGIHLDAWDTPPPGGGMSWFYGEPSEAQRAAIAAGLEGTLPTLFGGMPAGDDSGLAPVPRGLVRNEEKEKKSPAEAIGDALAVLGQQDFSAPRMAAHPGGPSQPNALLAFLSQPSATDMLLRKRMAGIV